MAIHPQAGKLKEHWLKLVLCVLSGALLFLPLAQSLLPLVSEPELRERLQPLQPRSVSLENLTDRSLQAYWEQKIARAIGLRNTLLAGFNDLRLALFPSRPNNYYVRSPEGGFFPVDTIRRFNSDLRNRGAVKISYDNAARRLRILQDVLAHRGVTLIVITAPPRVQLYPEQVAQYLALPPDEAARRIYSYGDALQAAGVTVVDGKALLLRAKQQGQPSSFADTGFHWNFWAACLVTAEAMQRIEAIRHLHYFPVDCSQRKIAPVGGPDADIALILNISQPKSLLGNTANVLLSQSDEGAGLRPPRIFLVGDSYADQITHTLLQTWPAHLWFPGVLTRSDYFVRNIDYNQRREAQAGVPRNASPPAHDLANSDVLILEVSDGNVYRANGNSHLAEFGATMTYLKAVLPASSVDGGNADAGLTYGWQADPNQGWYSSGKQAGLAFAPTVEQKILKLTLPITNLRASPGEPRILTISRGGKPLAEYRFSGANHVIDLAIPLPVDDGDPHIIELDIADKNGGALDLAVGKTKATQGGVPLDASMLPRAAAAMVDLIVQPEQMGINVTGLGGFERNATEAWRWGLGPHTRVRSFLTQDSIVELSFRFNTYQPNQVVEIRWNNELVHRYEGGSLRPGSQVADSLRLQGRAGVNRLDISYANWNGHQAPPLPHEARPISVVFLELAMKQSAP